jgi:hypothetical protein
MVRKLGRGVPDQLACRLSRSDARRSDYSWQDRALGSQFSTSEAQVLDLDGKLLASGRGI